MNVRPAVELLIFLINYKSGDIIQKAIESLNLEGLNYKIIILENGIGNEVDINDKHIETIISKENIGYTKGLNLLIDHARESYKYKYVLLMNPDVIASENLIQRLIKIIKDDKSIGCVYPKVVTINGATLFEGRIIDTKKCMIFSNSYQKPTEVDVYNGSFVLFRKETMMDIGDFDVNLFMYGDEAEYSIRMRKKKWKVIYCPHLSVKHYGAYSLRNMSHLKRYYFTRNYLYLFTKKLGKNNFNPALLKRLLKDFYFVLRQENYMCLIYFFRGIKDHFNQRYGKARS